MTEQTIVTAPSITDIVDAFSNDVVEWIATLGLPPLTDKKILIGRQHVAEFSAAPRIVFIPIGATYGPKSVTSAGKVPAPTSEQRREWQQRSIGTEVVVFEVHCWGQAVPPDDDQDWNMARALHHLVVQAAERVAPGLWSCSKGEWTDGKATSAQLNRAGREYVFQLSVPTPILGEFLPYVPAGTAAEATIDLKNNEGTTIETVVVT